MNLGWRSATFILLVGMALLLAIALAVFPARLHQASRTDGKEVNDAVHPGLASKWWTLVCSGDAWLSWLSLVSAGNIWVLGSFITVLLKDLYKISPGQAASVTAVFPAGMMCGLLCASVASGQLGVNGGRKAHLLQILVGASALAALAMWPHLPLRCAGCLIGLGCFGAVVPCYLPTLVFSADSLPFERAFRNSVLSATSMIASISITYVYGSWRESRDIEVQASLMYGSTSVGVALSCLTTAWFYRRVSGLDDTK
jgi:predicted MFS family arabinose efflux permease